MKLKEFLKGEFKGFKNYEKFFFIFVLLLISLVSIYLKDSKIALISAICGVSYTILAGKGKVLCYFIGITGTICYCYLAYKNGFFGNLLLYGLYYFPMEIIGIFSWLKNYNNEKREIKKTQLSKKEKVFYLGIFVFLSIVFIQILIFTNGKNPYIDGVTTIFSILGQLLTVKRCLEQWYIWLFVNILSCIMWIVAFMNGTKCAATIFMWIVYIFLSFYFLHQWKKDILKQ